MDTDKAYLLGLIIGGGVFGNAEDVFSIRLPYKKWGSYLENPQRAGEIAGDILRKVGQMFRAVYDLSVQYETTPGGTWTILCEGDTTAVKNDLMHYGIVCEGELRGSADISQVVSELVDDNLKRRFIAGLADTIGSMAKSQRRFTDEHQITIIWEPACGEGHMVSVLEKNGMIVKKGDIQTGEDFLKIPLKDCDWIITNPPFSIADKFIQRCHEHKKPFALLLKSQYWHAKKRLDIFRRTEPDYVLPLTWRPDFLFGERGSGSPLMDVMWVVWETPKRHNGTLYIPLEKPKKEAE